VSHQRHIASAVFLRCGRLGGRRRLRCPPPSRKAVPCCILRWGVATVVVVTARDTGTAVVTAAAAAVAAVNAVVQRIAGKAADLCVAWAWALIFHLVRHVKFMSCRKNRSPHKPIELSSCQLGLNPIQRLHHLQDVLHRQRLVRHLVQYVLDVGGGLQRMAVQPSRVYMCVCVCACV
jgi:hypothetical protein